MQISLLYHGMTVNNLRKFKYKPTASVAKFTCKTHAQSLSGVVGEKEIHEDWWAIPNNILENIYMCVWDLSFWMCTAKLFSTKMRCPYIHAYTNTTNLSEHKSTKVNIHPVNNLWKFTYSPADSNPVHTCKIGKFCLPGRRFHIPSI